MRSSKLSFYCILLCAAGALAGSPGCDDSGSYRITWSFSDGEITSTSDCSRRGVERVVVTLENPTTGETVKTSVHPCRDGGSGKLSVSTGTYRVRVQAYGGSGQHFVDPVTGEDALVELVGELQVRSSGLAEASVVFTANPRCSDGVDNDADGLVDAADPGCRDKSDNYLPSWDSEEDDVQNASLSVTWSIHGSTPCASIMPGGASQASLLVDNLQVGLYPCDDMAGAVPLLPGAHTMAMELLDASGLALATTPSQDASLVGGITTDLAFDFSLDTFDPPQTGELSFRLWWVSSGQTCSDASPVVAQQSLWLQDIHGATVSALTLEGTTVDNSPASVGQCVDASELQGLTTYIPSGAYTLSVSGLTSGGAQCWSAPGVEIDVPIGPAPAPLELVVPQTDSTGICAP